MKFFFDIEPVPHARPRFTRRGHTYTRSEDRVFQNHLKQAALAEMYSHKMTRLLSPVRLDVLFLLRRGKTVNRPLPSVKPDLSNLLKNLEDALNGVVYHDDSQIVEIRARKEYASRPGIELLVEDVQ